MHNSGVDALLEVWRRFDLSKVYIKGVRDNGKHPKATAGIDKAMMGSKCDWCYGRDCVWAFQAVAWKKW